MRLKRISGILFTLAFLAIISVLFSCQNEKQLEFDRYYSAGSLVYQQHCQNCHGAKGEGLQSLIPPLTDSVYLKNKRNSLACFVKFGLKEKITVSDKVFEGAMPANELAPIEIAEVLTYVTNSFGNKIGTINQDIVSLNLTNCK